MTSDVDSRGAGATARLRAKGGGGDAEIEIEIVEDDRRADRHRVAQRQARRPADAARLRARGRRGRRDAGDVHARACSKGSIIDQVTWALPRSHLERQYAQAMLRLKGLLEGDPRGL